MTCRELADFLLDYVTGELPEDTRRIFDEHLSLCETCRHYLDAYRATVRLGRRAFEDDARLAEEAAIPDALVRAILASRAP